MVLTSIDQRVDNARKKDKFLCFLGDCTSEEVHALLMLFLPCDGDVKDKSCAKGTGPCKSHEINTQGSAGWTAGQAKFGKGSCDLTKGFLNTSLSCGFAAKSVLIPLSLQLLSPMQA